MHIEKCSVCIQKLSNMFLTKRKNKQKGKDKKTIKNGKSINKKTCGTCRKSMEGCTKRWRIFTKPLMYMLIGLTHHTVVLQDRTRSRQGIALAEAEGLLVRCMHRAVDGPKFVGTSIAHWIFRLSTLMGFVYTR